MKKISILLLVLWGVIPSMLFAQRQLSFQNGKFKIVQFTDLHWTSGSPKCAETESTIRTILKSENPDIAILTGDIVTEAPAINGWMSVVEIFNNAKVPFVVTMGNHDAEHMAKDSIYDLLQKSPYYVGTKGPGDVMGCGNCVIPIFDSMTKKKVESVL